jgi:hypothetical protein
LDSFFPIKVVCFLFFEHVLHNFSNQSIFPVAASIGTVPPLLVQIAASIGTVAASVGTGPPLLLQRCNGTTAGLGFSEVNVICT